MANHAAVRQEAHELRDIIRKIITELDEHHRNVNIATATGSAASFLGGGQILIIHFSSLLKIQKIITSLETNLRMFVFKCRRTNLGT